MTTTCERLRHQIGGLRNLWVHVTDEDARTKIEDRIAALEVKLQDAGCTELDASFTGIATIWIANSAFPNGLLKKVRSFAVSLAFLLDPTLADEEVQYITTISIQMRDGDPSVTQISPQVGDSAGSFTPTSGNLSLSITLRASQFPFSDSDIDFGFSAAGTITTPDGTFNGALVDTAGNVTLVAASQFTTGSLNGSPSQILLEGAISPPPRA